MSESDRSFEEALGYCFQDARLLAVALTHRSAAFEAATSRRARLDHNERMEFLGDAVLSYAVSDALYQRCPDATEGELTRMRAAAVNEARLAGVASSLGLGDALRLGRGEDRTGGRAKPSLLANTLEAVFAAVYLDAGIERARAVILAHLGVVIDEVVASAVGNRDEKSLLQEIVQGRHGVTPRYQVIDAQGPDHARIWHVELQVGEIVSARGTGRSKKAAEQDAARTALRALERAEPIAKEVLEGGQDFAGGGAPLLARRQVAHSHAEGFVQPSGGAHGQVEPFHVTEGAGVRVAVQLGRSGESDRDAEVLVLDAARLLLAAREGEQQGQHQPRTGHVSPLPRHRAPGSGS